MGDYFKDDEYWKSHMDLKLEDDLWIDDYKEYFKPSFKALDLGCGIGQYTAKMQEYGMDVVSGDISKIALEKVLEINKNIVNLDMRESLPFDDNTFDLVFANLSIHYFNESDTKKLMNEVNRILKKNGIFIGSVNGIEGLNKIKDTARNIEHHFYYNKGKYIRLFDEEDLYNFLSIFKIIKIEKRVTVRFQHQKNYLIFIVSKGE